MIKISNPETEVFTQVSERQSQKRCPQRSKIPFNFRSKPLPLV